MKIVNGFQSRGVSIALCEDFVFAKQAKSFHDGFLKVFVYKETSYRKRSLWREREHYNHRLSIFLYVNLNGKNSKNWKLVHVFLTEVSTNYIKIKT